jgi:catalase
MSNDLKAPVEIERPRLGKATTLARFALIGVALAAVAATFAYLGGWFSPNKLTPARLIDGFEQGNGVHSGFRRNHAKGWAFPGSSRAMGTASVCRKRPSFDRGACR